MSTIFHVGTPGRMIWVAEEAEGNGNFIYQDKHADNDRWKPISCMFPQYLEEIVEHGIRENNPEFSEHLKAAAKKILTNKQ